MDKTHPTLLELAGTLRALHYQGYVSARGYSFAERDDQFGEGSIAVQAIAIAPPAPPNTPARAPFWKTTINTIIQKLRA